MAALEDLRKKLQPLFDAEQGLPSVIPSDPLDSCMVSDGGTINLLSRSLNMYNINELGLQKLTGVADQTDANATTYKLSSHEMHVFGTIGSGASSIVQRALYIPVHRVIALKKINVFEKEKRQQILNEIRTLCEATKHPGLVEFHGAFYSPDSGQISIALEYMDAGSLSDVLKVKKKIREPILSHIVKSLLQGLCYLHGVRHMVHRDLKPANVLVNLKGEPKITDFGVSGWLDNSMAMCATFVGTVTYMSPERIRSENYSYSADIWSLGLTVLECATGHFPYAASEGLANLMLQILYDPSPKAPIDAFTAEFCSFVDACLQKDAEARPTAEQLLSHPFIVKYDEAKMDLGAYIRSIVNPEDRLKDIADMITVHYYVLFNGSDGLWFYMKTFYTEKSTLTFAGKKHAGQEEIFRALSDVRKKLGGSRSSEKIVHVVETVHCRPHNPNGVMIRATGSFILGSHFLICGKGLHVEGMPSIEDLPLDMASKRVGSFREQFVVEQGHAIGCYAITEQEMFISQSQI